VATDRYHCTETGYCDEHNVHPALKMQAGHMSLAPAGSHGVIAEALRERLSRPEAGRCSKVQNGDCSSLVLKLGSREEEKLGRGSSVIAGHDTSCEK
jgi:hypothetical protein